MIRILFIFLFVLPINKLLAQDNSANDSLIKSSTTIIKDNRLDKLEDNYKATFKLIGYRVQIFSGTNKQPARDARYTFVQSYNSVKSYEIYEQPYFKVRVGDFKTKIEALKFKNELTKHFPNCFIVNDEIEFKEN